MAEEQPGYIDGILSTHFDECSIAAADAARSAEGIFDTSTLSHNESMGIVGPLETNEMQKFAYIPLTSLDDIDREIVVGTVTLGLAKPTHDYQSRPTLVALMNSDTLLPLATFERRGNGQCSYVQIGQEMEDDNLVATPNAPRMSYVEAIRDLMNNYEADPDAGMISDSTRHHLTHLVRQEVDAHYSSIEAYTESSVCRLAMKYLQSQDGGLSGVKELNNTRLLNREAWTETDRPNDYVARNLTPVFDDSEQAFGGHAPEIVLASRRSQAEPEVAVKRRLFGKRREIAPQSPRVEQVELLATLRGGVALKLAEFSADGHLTLADEDEGSRTRLQRLLLEVLPEKAEHTRQIIAELRMHYEHSLYRGRDTVVRVIEKADGKIGIVNVPPLDREHWTFDNYQRYDDFVKPGDHGDWAKFRTKVLETPDVLGTPSTAGKIAKAALISRADIALEEVVTALNVQQRIESYIGKGDTPTERLIQQLGRIVSEGNVKFSGVLRNKKAGKTTTDVDTKIVLSNGNHQLRILVEGRPTSLDGFDYVTLFDETLLLDTKNEHLDEEKVKEIAGVIGAICIQKHA